MADFDTALAAWLDRAGKIAANPLSIDPRGKKYVRIVDHMSNGQDTVFCFIDKATGNVLFAAGWKAPTKHSPVRGNIWTVGEEGVDKYGAHYIK
jgi:hypothetical protein